MGSSVGTLARSSGLVIRTKGGRFGGGSTTVMPTLAASVAPWVSVAVSVRVRGPLLSKTTCTSQPVTGKGSSGALLVHTRREHSSCPPGSLRSEAWPRSTTLAVRNTSAPSCGWLRVSSGGLFTTSRTMLAVVVAPALSVAVTLRVRLPRVVTSSLIAPPCCPVGVIGIGNAPCLSRRQLDGCFLLCLLQALRFLTDLLYTLEGRVEL